MSPLHSESEPPCDPIPPPPKQPRTDQGLVSTLNNVADVAMKRSILTETKKYHFYCNHFTPGIDFKFPREHSRSFQHQYLRRYYSQQQNGGYCLPCVLFARSTDARKGKGMFVETAFTNFRKAYDICNAHADRQYHKDAVVACDAFIERMSGRRESVAVELSRGLKETIQKKRKRLHSIVETIILCGRQNIALRGHRDSGTDLEGLESGRRNHGNFWALLHFRISAGDNILRDHLQSAPRNATYTSPDVQNQIINILGDQIRDKILSKVRSSPCYTLIADEVTDCSNKEQLCIVLRYVEPDSSSIREDLVTFLECDSGVTGEALANKMLGFVSVHLDPSKLRGQAYDGASNMSGKTNGAAARITAQYPLALYTHCASHCLNLAVVSSFEETSVHNMIGVVNRLYVFFFAHPKRQKKLEEAIHNTQPESTVQKLKDLCRTRWVERIDAFDRIKTLHSSIVACFESISAEGTRMWSSDSVTDASTLLLAITSTEFISALVITHECLQYLRGLTTSLQEEAKDIIQAVSEINTLTSSLKQVRENVDFYHDKWFDAILKMCSEVGTTPSIPRICGRQRHRASTPAASPTEYYRRTITIPILDHLLTELERRFSTHQKTAFQGLYLVPSVLVTEDLETVTSAVMKFGEQYAVDLPCISSLRSEVHNWHTKWKTEEKNHGMSSLPFTLSSTLPRISAFYPNIKALLTVLCTLPVTTCTAERSFSGLKRMKTAARCYICPLFYKFLATPLSLQCNYQRGDRDIMQWTWSFLL